MSIDALAPWITTLSSLAALIVAVITAMWAYAKFVVERGLLPPAQFGIECSPLGTQHDWTLLELVLHLENRGSSALIATNIRLDLRFIDAAEVPVIGDDEGSALLGRLTFPHSLRRDLVTRNSTSARPAASAKPRGAETRGFVVMPHPTFIQTGIDQQYTFETAVPISAGYVLAWASFEYAQRPVRVQRFILWICRRLGLIQFTLQHVAEGHTVERVFKLSPTPMPPGV